MEGGLLRVDIRRPARGERAAPWLVEAKDEYGSWIKGCDARLLSIVRKKRAVVLTWNLVSDAERDHIRCLE
jgi:hypothetical protein